MRLVLWSMLLVQLLVSAVPKEGKDDDFELDEFIEPVEVGNVNNKTRSQLRQADFDNIENDEMEDEDDYYIEPIPFTQAALDLNREVDPDDFDDDLDSVNFGMVASDVVKVEEVPYQAGLFRDDMLTCGGTLITHWHIVTAAHCLERVTRKRGGILKVDGDKFYVKLGATDASRDGKSYRGAYAAIHPDFDDFTLINDIGVLQVESYIKFNSMIQPAGVAFKEPKVGTTVYISGYGDINPQKRAEKKLRGAEMKIVDRRACERKVKDFGQKVTNTMLCAGGDRKDSCKGDSGGPMVSAKKHLLVGVVSWGIGCGRSGMPGVYTSVVRFRKWVQTAVDKLMTYEETRKRRRQKKRRNHKQ